MKITISKSQWVEMGRKAGWENPKLDQQPPMGQVTGDGETDEPIFEKESEIQDAEVVRLFNQIIQVINPTVTTLANRFAEGNADAKDVLQMRYWVLDAIAKKIENMVQGHV